MTDTPTERESASAIGLPIVLVVGWYHGERGQQRVSGPELALLTLLLLIGVGLLWLYAQRSAPTTTDVTAVKPTPTSASDARPSIAVLPFENRSRLEDDAFFVDGIHDDIITQLSKVGALRVISRTSVEQFRDTKLPMKAIADQLGVTKILEGGVQRAGGRVRIHMQLIDAAADEHLWAESYDRDLTAANIFAIQSEMAEAIAAALRTALTRTEHAQAQILPTRSLAAWEAYQLGKQRMASRTSAGLAEAERHSRRGVAVDPRFALAWVGLADSLAFQTSYSGRSKDAGLREADQAVARALELHPTLAEAWATAGRIAFNRRQFARAEELLSRAIALNPNHALAHAWLTIALLELGRRNEALAMAESAVVLDPLSVVINANLGRARMEVGRFDEARVAFGQAIKIDPTTPMAYSFIAATFAEELGRLDRALPWYEKAASLDPGSPNLLANVAARYWELGEDAEAGRWLARTLALGKGTSYTNATAVGLYLSRGDMESARRHARLAAEMDSWNMLYLRDFDLRDGDSATARARYAAAFPNLLARNLPALKNDRDAPAAVELAVILQATGENERARALLDRSELFLRTIPLFGNYRFYEVAIHALRGDTEVALTKLREAAQAGARSDWRYFRDFAPEFASIRGEPEFKRSSPTSSATW